MSLKFLLTVWPSIITATMTTMMTPARMHAYSVAATAASLDGSLRARRLTSPTNWASIPLTFAPRAVECPSTVRHRAGKIFPAIAARHGKAPDGRARNHCTSMRLKPSRQISWSSVSMSEGLGVWWAVPSPRTRLAKNCAAPDVESLPE